MSHPVEQLTRKRMTRHCLLAVLVLLLGCDQPQTEPNAKAPSAAPNVRADYEFQERCGKAAASWFNVRYDGQALSEFSNHYNRKLNKCFVLAMGSIISKDGVTTWAQLHDIHENKQYGDFMRGKEGW